MTLKELLKGVNYKIEYFEKTQEGITFNILKPEVPITPYKETWKYYRIVDLKTNKLILHIGRNKIEEEYEFFVANFGHELVEDPVFLEIFNEIAYLYSKQEKNRAAAYFYAKQKNNKVPYVYSKHERNKKATYKLISDAVAMNRQLFAQSKVRA
jgi:hypothetical protein